MTDLFKFSTIIIFISSLSCEVATYCNLTSDWVLCDSIGVPSEISQPQQVLEINGFKRTSLPQYLFQNFKFRTILIQSCEIKVLRGKTFVDLPRVEYLNLLTSQIEIIQPGAFKNLTELQTLNLQDNKLKIIQAGSFTNLPIRVLYLSFNSIATIEDSALCNLPNLRTLELGYNEIENISISEIMDDPSELVDLNLRNNSLKTLSNDMLKGLKNLKKLHLMYNKIEKIEEGTFQQTPNLTYLELSHNKIKKVDGKIFPRGGLPSLGQILLIRNELMYLTSDFFTRLPYLRRIALDGNPWLCPCMDAISRTLYDNNISEYPRLVDDHVPICISEASGTQYFKCPYKYNSELSSRYFEETKNVEFRIIVR